MADREISEIAERVSRVRERFLEVDDRARIEDVRVDLDRELRNIALDLFALADKRPA